MNSFFNRNKHNIILTLIFAILIGISIWLSDSEMIQKWNSYAMNSLDEKKLTVAKLTVGASGISTLMTFLPGDTATPVAQNMADIADYLMVVFAGIWLQKYLLTSMSIIGLKVLVPFGLALAVILEWFNKPNFRNTFIKLALMGVILSSLVPLSIWLTDQIDSTYQTTIDQTLEQAETLAQANASDEEVNENATSQANVEKPNETTGNVVNQITGFASDVVEGVGNLANDTVNAIANTGKDLTTKFNLYLTNLIESVTVLIVVNCIAPILNLFFLIWMVNLLFSMNISYKMPKIGVMRGFVNKKIYKR